MGIPNPFGPLSQALGGLSRQQESIRLRRDRQQKQQESQLRSQTLASFLQDTDLSNQPVSETITDIIAITGNASLAPQLFRQLNLENVSGAKIEQQRQAQIQAQQQTEAQQRLGGFISQQAPQGFTPGERGAITGLATQLGLKLPTLTTTETPQQLAQETTAREIAKQNVRLKETDEIPTTFSNIFTPESINSFRDTNKRQAKRDFTQLDFLPGFLNARSRGEGSKSFISIPKGERESLFKKAKAQIKAHSDFKELSKRTGFLSLFTGDFSVEDFVDKIEGTEERLEGISPEFMELLDFAFLVKNRGDLIQKLVQRNQIPQSILSALTPSGEASGFEGQPEVLTEETKLTALERARLLAKRSRK